MAVQSYLLGFKYEIPDASNPSFAGHWKVSYCTLFSLGIPYCFTVPAKEWTFLVDIRVDIVPTVRLSSILLPITLSKSSSCLTAAKTVVVRSCYKLSPARVKLKNKGWLYSHAITQAQSFWEQKLLAVSSLHYMQLCCFCFHWFKKHFFLSIPMTLWISLMHCMIPVAN
jgi:hypothetical protein